MKCAIYPTLRIQSSVESYATNGNSAAICFALVVQSVLLLVICQLLFLAKLGRYADLIFLSEALLILIVSPYLACSGLNKHFAPLLSTNLLQMSRMHPRQVGMSVVLGSQIYTFCFLALTSIAFTILIPSISDINYLQVLQLQLVCGLYIIVAASVGGLWWRVFRHEIFATEVTYLGLDSPNWRCVSIGTAGPLSGQS